MGPEPSDEPFPFVNKSSDVQTRANQEGRKVHQKVMAFAGLTATVIVSVTISGLYGLSSHFGSLSGLLWLPGAVASCLPPLGNGTTE